MSITHPPLTEPATRYLRVEGRRLAYRETGDPAGRPIVVLHGLMGHAFEWDVLAAALAGPGHRVLALEQRGHGRSDWSPSYTLAALVDDLREFLRRPEVFPAGDRVDLIGHSLGGLVAAALAADRPDLVRRLVLIDIGPESLTTVWGRETLPQVLAEFAAASYAEESEAVAEWLAGDPLAREPLLRHYVRHALRTDPDGRLRWRFDAARFPDLVAGLDPAQAWRALDRITAPTLLIRGAHSHLLSPEAAAGVTGRLRDGRLVEIPGGGHDLGVQRPEAVAAAAAAFLD